MRSRSFTLSLVASLLPVLASGQTTLNGDYTGTKGANGIDGENGWNGRDGRININGPVVAADGEDGGKGRSYAGDLGGSGYITTGSTLILGGTFSGGQGGDGGKAGNGGNGGRGMDAFPSGYGGNGGNGGDGGDAGNGGQGGYGLVVATNTSVEIRGGSFSGGRGGSVGTAGIGGQGGQGGQGGTKMDDGFGGFYFIGGGSAGRNGKDGVAGSMGGNGLGMLVQGTATLYGTGTSTRAVGDIYRATGQYLNGAYFDFTYRLQGGSFSIQGAPSVPGPVAALPFAVLALRRRRK